MCNSQPRRWRDYKHHGQEVMDLIPGSTSGFQATFPFMKRVSIAINIKVIFIRLENSLRVDRTNKRKQYRYVTI